jgi:uncharacterized SAM-binding protein YcdF (DUF218 family)
MLGWAKGAAMGVVTAFVIVFGLGFFSFATSVQRAAPPLVLAEADAVVALTGGSKERLVTGMHLLAEGRGRRLLISGVNPAVRDEDVHALLEGAPDLIACCVDLGRQAEDTLGNASETAAWATRNGFTRLIIVTDDYHLPRSLVELRLALPDAQLIGYPVKSRVAHARVWTSDLAAAGRLAGEYVKYIMIRTREQLLSPKPNPKSAPAA